MLKALVSSVLAMPHKPAHVLDSAAAAHDDVQMGQCAKRTAHQIRRANSSLFVGYSWADYRIGDVVDYGLDNSSRGVYIRPASRRMWPSNSLLGQLLHARSALEDGERYSTLAHLVLEQPLPGGAESWCTLHIRLGDVAECDAASVDAMLVRQVVSKRRAKPGPGCGYDAAGRRLPFGPKMLYEGRHYIRPLRAWDVALQKAGGTAVCRQLHLVAGSKDDLGVYPKSLEYLYRLAQHLCALGYEPRLRLRQSPDEDLVVFVRSRVFLSSGGGMSSVVERLRSILQSQRQQQQSQRQQQQKQQRQRRSVEASQMLVETPGGVVYVAEPRARTNAERSGPPPAPPSPYPSLLGSIYQGDPSF